MKIDVDMYKHRLEDEYFKKMKMTVFCEDSFIKYYKNFVEEFKKPKLIGKSIKVTENQFSRIYIIVKNMCKALCMPEPEVYLYGSSDYKISTEGLKKPFILISSKVVENFTEKELEFLIGKELVSIKSGHVYWKIVIKQCIAAPNLINNIPEVDVEDLSYTIDSIDINLKKIMCTWARGAEYSSDAGGYLLSRDIKACVNAIKKISLNDSFLAKNLKLSEYIKQGDLLYDYNSNIANYSRIEESVPYGPCRIKELLKFVSLVQLNL